jgi:ABC-type polysaccharide transport system permease subunit
LPFRDLKSLKRILEYKNIQRLVKEQQRFQAMRDAMFADEPFIRLAAFGGVFVVMVIWELARPRRQQAIGRGWRWPNNLGVVVVDTLLVAFFSRPQPSVLHLLPRNAALVSSM